MNLFRVLWDIHSDVKEIKKLMAKEMELLAETRKDLERLIQGNSASATLVTMLQAKVADLEAQLGAVDPAAQQTLADLKAGLQQLDDTIEAASPETPPPPTEPPTQPPIIPAAS